MPDAKEVHQGKGRAEADRGSAARSRHAVQAAAVAELPAALDPIRRAARVVSLLALDLAAIVGAIFTALCLKAVARDAWNPHVSWEQAKDYVPFAFLVASLLFARSGLYAERAQRRG